MNHRLELLQPYPFERLRKLVADVTPAGLPPIDLTIGEPRHPTPELVRNALVDGLDGLGRYPATAGGADLHEAIAAWLMRRYGLDTIDAAAEVLPVNGSREALFAFTQTVIDPDDGGAVVCPNPFYQIYEGATLLAGARPVFLDQRPENGFRCPWESVGHDIWRKVRLAFVCSPGNPTGSVVALDEWKTIFALSDKYGFVIAADECYSEIYEDEQAPPIGALQAAHLLGRGYERLVVFSSLSKRSNAPGMRSGFVAGDRHLLARFLHYRTYHGSAMSPPIQRASIAAWRDEAHVTANRAAYRRKFDAVVPVLAPVLRFARPSASFYLWAAVPGGDDARFCRDLLADYNVRVLPGSFLSRGTGTGNPGLGFVRIALVDEVERCVEAARRIREFIEKQGPHHHEQ